MSSNVYIERTDKLRNILSCAKEAALITNEVNIGYLCGFFHSEGAFLLTSDDAYLLVDFRYIEAAQNKAHGCKIICFKNFIKDISAVLSDNKIETVFVESAYITAADYDRYKTQLRRIGVDCVCSNKLDAFILNMRIIKDESEYQKILSAQKITEKSYLEVLNDLKPGVTEKQIAAKLEYLMKLNGAEDVSFSLITITGQKTSLPHGVPTDDCVKAGDFFTFDIGAVYDGYHSDTTRTVAVKSASSEMKEIYDIVLKAQINALEHIKEGVTCKSVDDAARSVISDAGYGEYFGHSTGHGVGLDIHETPNVSYRNNTVLKEGMVITDEPGIYLPSKFGVRIEDMVYVTKNGYKNFVTLPKELIIV